MNGRPVTFASASTAHHFVRGAFTRFTLVPLFTSWRPYTYSG
ncbi:MAG: hypothetical protein QF554_06070 [Dehalococcoidia bacterium]|nr:hypothetical protein [Dehalococcoidia bacterium]